MAAWCAQRAIRQYDGGTNAAGTPTTSGLAGGDTVSSLTQSFASKDVLGLNGSTPHVNGGYVVNDGNAGGNYSVTLNPAAGTITRAGLTVTAQTDNRGYNGTAGSNVAPVVAGTLYDRVGTAATQVYDTKHVGATHTLSASGLVVNDGNGGNNYAITYVNSPAAGVINAAPLTVTANSQAKAYGSTLTFAGSEITPTGLQNGETVGSVTLASAGAVNTAHAAGYAITASAATGGTFTPSDCTITYVNGALTVNPAALSISADNAVRNVNQPNPPFTATYNGFKLGETPAVLTGVLAFTTPAVISSPSGLYKIVPSGQSATDYAYLYQWHARSRASSVSRESEWTYWTVGFPVCRPAKPWHWRPRSAIVRLHQQGWRCRRGRDKKRGSKCFAAMRLWWRTPDRNTAARQISGWTGRNRETAGRLSGVGKAELAPRFIHCHGDRVGEIEAAARLQHRQAQSRCHRKFRENFKWQTACFGTKHKYIARLKADVVITHGAARGDCKHATTGQRRPAMRPVIVQRKIHAGPVVHAGALELLVGQRKAERPDHMQPAAGIRAQSHHVAGVRRDFGFIQNDFQHGKIPRKLVTHGKTRYLAATHAARCARRRPFMDYQLT